LNIPKPRWMQGFSLFENQEMNSQILIATFGKSKVVEGVWSIDTKYSNPPFYQFDTVALINCDKFVRAT